MAKFFVTTIQQFPGMQGQGQALGQRRPLGFPPQTGPGQGQGQSAFGTRSGPPPPPLGQQMVIT